MLKNCKNNCNVGKIKLNWTKLYTWSMRNVWSKQRLEILTKRLIWNL